VLIGAALVLVASCGSRTGLFVDSAGMFADAAVGDIASRDAALDAIDDGPLACVPGTFGFAVATPQLMFVLDRSGSMDFALDANEPAQPGRPSRWTALRDALAQVMTPFSDQIAMGARFYPAADADEFDLLQACAQDPEGVAIPPALFNTEAILGVFARTSPIGGTPTAAALELAAAQLSSSRAIARAILVATDGAPNCNSELDGTNCVCTSIDAPACSSNRAGGSNCLDDTRTVRTITDVFTARRIPVYVVGIGVTGSFSATLDAMAVAGGRPRARAPRYYPADTPAALFEAFTVVRDSVAKCSYITPSSPNDPNAISVDVAGAKVRRDPDHIDGWDWIDQAYGHLQLFGSACEQATASNVSGTVTCNKDE
jgi:hypothetical protein